MKKEIFYCDVCGKEVSESNLHIKTISVIKEIYATGGIGNVKLFRFGDVLEFKEQELCPECKLIYEQIYTKYMTMIAEEWGKVSNEIKREMSEPYNYDDHCLDPPEDYTP